MLGVREAEVSDERERGNAYARRTIDPLLADLCRRLAEDLATVLPEGMGFVMFLSATKTPGSGGEPLVAGSNISRDEGVVAMYHWIETLGERGTGVPLRPTIRNAIEILKATAGRGLSARAITPARALAMGVQCAMMTGFDCDHEPDEAEFHAAALKAIVLLEEMILAEPTAEAELAVERAAKPTMSEADDQAVILAELMAGTGLTEAQIRALHDECGHDNAMTMRRLAEIAEARGTRFVYVEGGFMGAPVTVVDTKDAKSFTCPVCKRVSHNPNDLREGYCGACHDFTGERGRA